MHNFKGKGNITIHSPTTGSPQHYPATGFFYTRTIHKKGQKPVVKERFTTGSRSHRRVASSLNKVRASYLKGITTALAAGKAGNLPLKDTKP